MLIFDLKIGFLVKNTVFWLQDMSRIWCPASRREAEQAPPQKIWSSWGLFGPWTVWKAPGGWSSITRAEEFLSCPSCVLDQNAALPRPTGIRSDGNKSYTSTAALSTLQDLKILPRPANHRRVLGGFWEGFGRILGRFWLQIFVDFSLILGWFLEVFFRCVEFGVILANVRFTAGKRWFSNSNDVKDDIIFVNFH